MTRIHQILGAATLLLGSSLVTANDTVTNDLDAHDMERAFGPSVGIADVAALDAPALFKSVAAANKARLEPNITRAANGKQYFFISFRSVNS